MTLQEAADRLIAIVGHDPSTLQPTSVTLPWHAWEEFVKAAHPPKPEPKHEAGQEKPKKHGILR